MIQNFWSNIKLYCINGHDTPIPMVVMEGKTPFYACPHYMLKDEEHPDGHEEDEKMCINRISFTAATNVINKFMKMIEQDDDDDVMTSYEGMPPFDYNGITVKVLKYTDEDIRLGIINRRALK